MERTAYRILVRKPEGMRPHGRTKNSGRIKLNRISGWSGIDGVHVTQDGDQWR
jgi:hypothetical protein